MIYLIALMALLSENKMFDLVEKTELASLATLNKDKTPFVSLVPYALDKGQPVIFISDLAIHTSNLKDNSACSLMVSKPNKKDIFESPRLSYIGKMVKVSDKEVEEIKKIYLKKFPKAEYLMELGDFAFYKLKIEKIYYVGEFASADWVDLKDYNKHWAE